MKLLYIEDNVELVESIRHFLAANSTLVHAQTGKEGLRLAQEQSYDAIILDLGLPDMSGIDVCLEIRRIDVKVPIIVLSGHQDINVKVSLFEAGADDYVTKPFTVAELRARLFALLRRVKFNSVDQGMFLLKVGDLTLEPLSRQVKRSGQPIRLRRKEFDILEYLMYNRDKIVTRSMIMDNAWEPNSSSWDGTINVHIKRLRDKIDRPYGHKLIKTAYGLGYTINDNDSIM